MDPCLPEMPGLLVQRVALQGVQEGGRDWGAQGQGPGHPASGCSCQARAPPSAATPHPRRLLRKGPPEIPRPRPPPPAGLPSPSWPLPLPLPPPPKAEGETAGLAQSQIFPFSPFSSTRRTVAVQSEKRVVAEAQPENLIFVVVDLTGARGARRAVPPENASIDSLDPEAAGESNTPKGLKARETGRGPGPRPLPCRVCRGPLGSGTLWKQLAVRTSSAPKDFGATFFLPPPPGCV